MTFRDSQGREYSTRVTLATYLELKKHGIDLNDTIRGDLFTRLAEDVALLVDALWIVVAPSAGGITQEQFAQSLDGDTLEAAVDALMDGIIDFFPQSKRAALRSLLRKGREVDRLQAEKLTAAVENLTPESILESMRSSLPESSGSSPGDSPSEN